MESTFLNPQKAVRAAQLQEGDTVADFGAGAGFFARAAARAVGPAGTVWAVDADRALLARLLSLAMEEGLANVEIVGGNIEERGGSHLVDESADTVLLTNVLFSAHDRRAVVEEVWRVLKMGGKVLAVDWQGSFGGLGPPKEHVLAEADARTLFETGGFKIGAAIPAGHYHWGFIARKVK